MADAKMHICPTCGATTRERVLMQFFSVMLVLFEVLRHHVF